VGWVQGKRLEKLMRALFFLRDFDLPKFLAKIRRHRRLLS